MENFQPQDVTQQAQAIAQQYTTERTPEGGTNFGKVTPTIPSPNSINPSRGKRAVKLKVRDVDEVAFGTEDIDLASVEQIVEAGQLRAIALAIVYAKEKYIDSERSLSEILDEVMNDISDQGLDIIILKSLMDKGFEDILNWTEPHYVIPYISNSGRVTQIYMKSEILRKPRIKKTDIKRIILGGGQNLLSPERRFDAIVYNSPDLFD